MKLLALFAVFAGTALAAPVAMPDAPAALEVREDAIDLDARVLILPTPICYPLPRGCVCPLPLVYFASRCLNPVCPPSFTWNQAAGRCDPPPCPKLWVWDKNQNRCVPKGCPGPGWWWNAPFGKCSPPLCPDGLYYSMSQNKCVYMGPPKRDGGVEAARDVDLESVERDLVDAEERDLVESFGEREVEQAERADTEERDVNLVARACAYPWVPALPLRGCKCVSPYRFVNGQCLEPACFPNYHWDRLLKRCVKNGIPGAPGGGS